MDTFPQAPARLFRPLMPLSPRSRIMSLSEIQLRDSGTVVKPSSPDVFALHLAKASAGPCSFQAAEKLRVRRPSVAAVSAG